MKDTALTLNNAINDFLSHRAADVNWDNDAPETKWTTKEIIGHLIDSAQINLQRFVRCTYEEGFKLIYFQEEWVQAQHYRIADTENLLKLWELINRQIVRVLENYPPERIHIKCDNGRHGPSFNTVAFLAEDYVAHMQHHLNQLH
ncbi:DinB family protein [Mucilaginibacter sp. RB4R14]|uniref:DinB family protein n=1 Tax=Mucilaginibacter aurantiaciroseus TaxID=2949308 RepID=UPI0020919333|nr:DinB family protein [Mucilaginibacter aurantiaciroseus]MCO5935109.1 DinB family protein [Mucilaginibacter aurantiaciroseus]